jgi:MoaA/NifB/PqqE/SkfB family radical SAM enzyme
MAVILKRKEAWGEIKYDTSEHRFFPIQTNGKGAIPYPANPIVLNIDLTMKCNMDCMHCVTKDFDQAEDLVISKKLVDWINREPFMVVVITGGEPLLPEYENHLMTLLKGIRGKGLIVDTNGTILPSHSVIETIRDNRALVRISWDSLRPSDETYFRHVKPDTKRNHDINLEYYNRKVDVIHRLCSASVNVAIQSVVQKKNLISIVDMPAVLRKLSIKKWYIQRFIPSHKANGKNFEVSNLQYDQVTSKLIKKCHEGGIECMAKKDRRHNCVILLVGDGVLYTQGEKPQQKLQLGTIDSEIRYFDYVSSADHAERYYG